MRMMVVAAHPDDEVLGAGGTIARHAAAGDEVSIVILGEGAASRGEEHRAAIEQLQENGRQAVARLGASEILFESLPDNAFDSIPLLEIVKQVEKHKERFDPEVVLTHYAGDLNVDHRLTCEAVLTAFRGVAGERCRRIAAFYIPSSTEWGSPRDPGAFKPNSFVDIAAGLEPKLAAMACYESESRAFPHPRSPEALEATARYWGSTCGLEAAEPFMILREIWQ